MHARKIQRLSVREGYDLWSDTYDDTPNPVVRMDARHTVALLRPQAGEHVLDAGCGTGRNFEPVVRAGSRLTGVDFSHGMLETAKHRYPGVPLALGDLQQPLPFAAETFDAVLCALIGEHLTQLRAVFENFYVLLKPSGRLLFSVYHPAMAEAGKEAHFEHDGVEYRLGAERHGIEDYRRPMNAAGFALIQRHEFKGDAQLAAEVPSKARRLLDFPVLLIFEARKS
ncbi:MAG: class I SAM-dependent methyltransferase [Chloroflexi bacterium]|nr:MAG: class I SAM-dependent methyltransferase [Chloroflexota bacterium]